MNDLPLGRFWYVGPQFALFTLASWLKKGTNTVTFFDLEGSAGEHVATAPGQILVKGSGSDE